MSPVRRLARGLALGLLLLAAPARAADPTERLTEEAARFTGSAMVFVFFHELGHALIDLLDLPTVGKEEDVVDEFATWVFLKGARESDPQDADQGIQALLLAAESWRLLWKSTEAQLARGRNLPWWDEHSLDIQRYYNIVCLIYGSDPGRFWPLVVRAEMPIARARKCEHEWPQKNAAWERLLAGKYVREGESRPAGTFGRFLFLYGEAKSEFGRQLEADMRESRGFEQIVEALNAILLLPPVEVPVIAKDCGFANAFWSGAERRIVLCWEMFRFFLDAYVEELKAQAAAPGGAGRPPPAPAPGPAPEPPPQAGGLDMGPLGPLLAPAATPPWTRTIEAGRFVARNTTEPDNLWRVFVPGEAVPAGRRRIAVTVAAQGARATRGAGLAYGVEEAANRAFYLLLDSEGRLTLRAEQQEGGRLSLRTLANWPAARPAAAARLELVEQGGTLVVLADGRELARLAEPGFGRGAIGIAAWGTGTFAFERFALADADAPRPTPVPQPPPQAGPAPQPPAPQPPAPQPQPPVALTPALDPQLVGSWTAWPSDPQGRRSTIQLQLLDDGRYLETRWQATGAVQRIWGRWHAAAERLSLLPQGWDPWQACGPQGCQPVQVAPQQHLVYRLVAGTGLQIGPLLFYRGP